MADSYLDERLQKLEKQRQSLEAKIQREAQARELKATKKAQAKEERERKQAQKRELRESKKRQKEFSRDESTALQIPQNTSQRRTRLTQLAPNPHDKNGWFVALAPTIDVMLIYSNASSGATSYLFRFGAQYGATLEAGYLFGSGANAWRTYFSLGYGYGKSSDYGHYLYYNLYETIDVFVDIHNITHNAGIDWIPRIGNSSARGVLGFYNSFSYMIMRDSYEKYNLRQQCVINGALWWNSDCMIGGTQGIWQTLVIPAGEKQDFIHIFFIGIGTRLGVIFDIKEHFSLEIGSKISLHFSFLGANGNGGGLQFIQSVMPNFQQYLSFMYRF